MASDAVAFHEPANKRQKLNGQGVYLNSPEQRSLPSHVGCIGKSSAFDHSWFHNDSTNPETLNMSIRGYIPAGCIRVYKEDINLPISALNELWNNQDQWAAFAAPRDIYNTKDYQFLPNMAQEHILKASCLEKYQVLIDWGLIRAEFKANDSHYGQARVYLHHGGAKDKDRQGERYHKSVRKALKHLLRNLDISRETWNGEWDGESSISHVDSSLDSDDSPARDESLLALFNDLPSPEPSCSNVDNSFVRSSMAQLLSGDVPGLQTSMYSYQRKSAALMAQREASPGLVIDPRLRKIIDHNGNAWFCDPEQPYYSRNPRMYDAPRGGVLAENMGLGKTLICLALILATRAQPTTVPPEHSVGLLPIRCKTGSLMQMAAAALGRYGMPWKDEFLSAEADGYDFSNPKDAIKSQPGHYFIEPPASSRPSRQVQVSSQKILLSTTTLVVVPPNLLQQWLNEINKHTKSLKVLVMRDTQAQIPSPIEIIEYDILLFTKGRFDKEAKSGQLYRTPLKDVHFKRLIYDEGHTFGSASNSSQTEAFTLVNALHIAARWIVSGTPSQGLYSTGVSGANTPSLIPVDSPALLSDKNLTENQLVNVTDDRLFVEQERKDLVRLGNIAMYFLKARPWAASPDGDQALWQQCALQPRHGEKSHGNAECLRTTLEGMMIRHKLCDVDTDVQLPPLHESVVYLEPCLQNKFALNIFNLMIITNAVTSERKDADYFFHPKQSKNLQALVSNLRQASFFWSGFEIEHLEGTINIAQNFLTDSIIPTSDADVALLKEAIQYGQAIISNTTFQKITQWHEMPMYVENEWPNIMKSLLSMDHTLDSRTLMAPCMLFDAQKYLHQTENPSPKQFVIEAYRTLLGSDQSKPLKKSSRTSQVGKSDSRKITVQGPKLAGGVTIGQDPSPKKLSRASAKATPMALLEDSQLLDLELFEQQIISESTSQSVNGAPSNFQIPQQGLDTSIKGQGNADSSAPLLAEKLRSLLEPARIISTASTKLSYLLDRIIKYQEHEKILVFYEDSNTAYYIAQYLECLSIKHLIYARELSPEKRSRYVATFNATDTFRVLLMDVSQAAFGLDVSSASRVFFINPVFSPQVEAQAVKRAHRIGQKKPVYVETLVLRGSIEEVLVARRNVVSKEEHQKFKSILDDQTVYDWIRNVKLLPMKLDPVPGPEQMAPLQSPQKAFGDGFGSGYGVDPDSEIVKLEHFISEDGGNALDSRVKESTLLGALPYTIQEQNRALEWLSSASPALRSQVFYHLSSEPYFNPISNRTINWKTMTTSRSNGL